MLANSKKLLLISRPISWPNTAYPFAAAFLVTGGSFGITFWIATIYFLIPYNLLMYGVNDVFDYESDIRNPRKGGLEGAKEKRAFHPIILWSATLTNAPFIIYLLITGTFVSNLLFIGLIFFVLAYSIAGLRFKEIPVLDSITSSIHFVGPMVYAFTLTGLDYPYIPYVVAFFLWGAASHAFGAIQDIIPDRQGKLSSVATVLGARPTVRIVFLLYITASTILVTQGWPAALIGVAGLVYAGNVVPYLHITDAKSATANRGWRRFIWLNLFTGFVITMVLILTTILP
tara:strand:+ start:4269 stop:5129 length:861 start_codon:yes stop_codon:yes gene_type:complete